MLGGAGVAWTSGMEPRSVGFKCLQEDTAQTYPEIWSSPAALEHTKDQGSIT